MAPVSSFGSAQGRAVAWLQSGGSYKQRYSIVTARFLESSS